MNLVSNYLRLLLRELSLLRRLIYHRIYINNTLEKSTVDQFCKLYYDSFMFGSNQLKARISWLGITTRKCPTDFWIYQEIIFELRPDVIIECGAASGGSALFLASMCDLVNNGKVLTIDVEDIKGKPQHKRIRYLLGSSTSEEVVRQVRNLITHQDKVMVVLDSDHHKDHVLNELKIYSAMVSKGSYLIVEDTVFNGHPVQPEFGPGPMEAVDEFLKGNKDFVIDTDREKLYLTFNPRGYLRKVK